VIQRMLRLGGIFTLFFLFPSYLAADLGSQNYEMIRTAFINGYVRALRLDIETIESLKTNTDDMKKFVLSEAEKYMEEVSQLSR
jgi:hypothetical protein